MHSTTIARTGCLAELDTLWQQACAGVLTLAEYHTAFAMVDAAHSHDHLCVNGDHRQAITVIESRALCGVCAVKHYEVSADPPLLADEVSGYLLSLPRQVAP